MAISVIPLSLGTPPVVSISTIQYIIIYFSKAILYYD
jgi:hypothetical protein